MTSTPSFSSEVISAFAPLISVIVKLFTNDFLYILAGFNTTSHNTALSQVEKIASPFDDCLQSLAGQIKTLKINGT